MDIELYVLEKENNGVLRPVRDGDWSLDVALKLGGGTRVAKTGGVTVLLTLPTNPVRMAGLLSRKSGVHENVRGMMTCKIKVRSPVRGLAVCACMLTLSPLMALPVASERLSSTTYSNFHSTSPFS